MTTKAARVFEVQHQYAGDHGWAVYNPDGKPEEQLPIIFGFNNGGQPGWLDAALLAEDGTCLGKHICSHEGYMPSDLGVRNGTRPDRHETFRKHYPDGYRMVFVGYEAVQSNAVLLAAIELNAAKEDINSEAVTPSVEPSAATPAPKELFSDGPWSINPNNAVDANDVYSEWWEVSNEFRKFRCETEGDAVWLHSVLSERT